MILGSFEKKTFLGPDPLQVCKPCRYALVEAVEPFKLHPMSMSYIYKKVEQFLRLWMGVWLCIHILTTTDTSPELWELAEILLMQVCKPCHYALVKAVESFKLHPMSMAYIYEMFEHLLRLWMGIWLHIHIIDSTDASTDL
jgi:hypothetical protein